MTEIKLNLFWIGCEVTDGFRLWSDRAVKWPITLWAARINKGCARRVIYYYELSHDHIKMEVAGCFLNVLLFCSFCLCSSVDDAMTRQVWIYIYRTVYICMCMINIVFKISDPGEHCTCTCMHNSLICIVNDPPPPPPTLPPSREWWLFHVGMHTKSARIARFRIGEFPMLRVDLLPVVYCDGE